MVVEADPVADGARRVLDAVEALAMNALFLQCPDDALGHAVLLWAERGDKLLLQAVAADQRGVAPRGEDQAVVGPQKEFLRHLSYGKERTGGCNLMAGHARPGPIAPSFQTPQLRVQL